MGDTVRIQASRIVVVMPNWLGDAVMATPFLQALRGSYPEARIVAVARLLVAAVTEGSGQWPVVSGQSLVDELKVYAKGEEGAVSRWMHLQKFDLGILLPNSFRSAWMVWRGGVKRRVGYARGGRGWLLTDRLRAAKRTARQRDLDRQREAAIRGLGGGTRVGSGYQPVPTIEYYLELARRLRCERHASDAEVALADSQSEEVRVRSMAPDVSSNFDRRMVLGVADAERAEAEAALRELGIDNYIVMVPGANFGASKCWMPERFAAVADQMADKYGVKVALIGAPSASGT
jgi:heptosyltransferase-2